MPLKMKIQPNKHEYAIYSNSLNGLAFGAFCFNDIYEANNSNTTMYSYSKLGNSYKHQQYEYGTYEAQTFLAGSFNFQLDEIEVYQKE